MKYEKRGRLWLATAFLCLWIFTNVFEHQVTNFLFNLDAYQPADILAEIRNVVLITLLFVLGNWSVTTLMDGEGSLKDILHGHRLCRLAAAVDHPDSAGAADQPALLFAEKGYVDAILALAWALFFVLLFLGVLVVHQYTVFKTVVTTVLDPAGHRNYDFYRLCLYLPGLADGGLCVAHRQGTAAAAVKPKIMRNSAKGVKCG